MPETIQIEGMSTGDEVEMLRRQVLMFQGYAYALAQRAGLSPEEAGCLWFEALGDPARSARPPADPAVVERVAKGVATFSLALLPTTLECDGDTWTIRSVLTDATADLERWGAPLVFFVRWSAMVQRREGEASGGIIWETWQEGDSVYQRLSLSSSLQEGLPDHREV